MGREHPTSGPTYSSAWIARGPGWPFPPELAALGAGTAVLQAGWLKSNGDRHNQRVDGEIVLPLTMLTDL